MERDALVAQQARRVLREVVRQIGDGEHFHEERLVARLAVLADEQIGDLVGAIEHELLEPAQRRGAFGERLARPLLLGSMRGRGRFAYLRRRRHADLADELPAARLVDGQGAVRGDGPLRGTRDFPR